MTFSKDAPQWVNIDKSDLHCSLQVVKDDSITGFRPLKAAELLGSGVVVGLSGITSTTPNLASGSRGLLYFRTTGLNNSVQTVKAGPGNVFTINLINPNNSGVWVKFYDNAAVTLGSTSPRYTFQLDNSGQKTFRDADLPWEFTGQILVAATNGIWDSFTGALPLAVIAELSYK